MEIRNDQVLSLVAEIPAGHRHLRTTLQLADGSSITLQEATMAAMVRAYLGVKTHPTRQMVAMRGERLPERKDGFADWQLVEV
jgi:hypothetical protein